MSNKIKYGLKNVHYAVMNDNAGNISYETVKAIRGAVNLSLTPRGDKAEFYADDIVYFDATANQGYDGTLEIALIPDGFRKDVLKDKEDANGVLFEDSDVIPNNIALMFEFNGDSEANRHVLYNVSVARPNVEGETKGAQITPKTEKLNIAASPAVDTGYTKAKVTKGQSPYDTFFDSVYLEDAAINTPTTANVSFSKSSASDVTVAVTSSAAGNSVRSVKLDGEEIGGASLTVTNLSTVIDKNYLSGKNLSVGAHTITVVLNKGIAVNFALTVS